MPQRHLDQIGHRRSVPPSRKGEEERDGGRAYPRPLLRRAQWTSLNGEWEFAISSRGQWSLPTEPVFDRKIRVPFAPETKASGIEDNELYSALWYRRRVSCPQLGEGERLLVHFGAVDYSARVWIDGSLLGTHEGGYTPFWVDASDVVRGRSEVNLVVEVTDEPLDLGKPRGKQDWQLHPHSIWYPRTTGIWQTVWMEVVPATRIGTLRWESDLERWQVGLAAEIESSELRALRLTVVLRAGELVLADDEYSVGAGEVHRRIALSDPGIDDFRNELLWSPETPKLITAELSLVDAQTREVLDRVESYTALRSFAIDGDRFILNGRPYPLRLVLDQGYWPECGITAPNDDALRRDVELTKEMGFNGARKHQKIEDPRYLYWCDRLGLLVWEEMPSAYRFTRRSVERLTKQWIEVLERDASHPCIIAWVPFNESWGVPNLPGNPAERHYVQALYHLTKTIDPSRPVVGNDGWESVATDVIGIHDYDERPERIAQRYREHEKLPALFKRERPGGRALVLGSAGAEHPIVLSEFGGIAMRKDPTTWGYSCANGPEDFEQRYSSLLRVVRSLSVLSGFCYTQFADTYQEANGLLYADRTPKIPIERIRAATMGGGESRVAAAGTPNERTEAPE